MKTQIEKGEVKMTQKEKLAARFQKNYKDQGLRLLAIQLNGFSHKVFFDRGSKRDPRLAIPRNTSLRIE